MSAVSSADVLALVTAARTAYADDRTAVRTLDALEARLREPLRVAVAGMVKAGKSTLLNAMIGERIAPTDAGECTRAVTWYRHAHTPTITAHLVDGTARRLPVGRVEGRIDLDRAGLVAEDVDRIEVGWPAESLRRMVLIDTPGIGSLSADTSARSTRFLTSTETPVEADAVIYLLRHLHATDLRFLEAFRDVTGTANAIAVLSRADEIGSGRIDSMISASRIAQRYRRDGELRALALGTVPIAGLLAEGGRTLREDEFTLFRRLAELDRPVRDAMLLSADRFLQPRPAPIPTIDERRRLLDRFGVFGVRLGAALVRGGVRTSTQLAERLVLQSGLRELETVVDDQFRARATALKARAVLGSLRELVRERPRPAERMLPVALERVEANLHDLDELSLLAALRTQPTRLAAAEAAAAERILGGEGVAPRRRLGLAGEELADERVTQIVSRWRALSERPLADRTLVEMCRLVLRSAERAASELDAAPIRATGFDVVPGGRPT